ncbi:hypothetical protein [Butyrivibrio sp. YAB3001]|uniref:hypothetical protein n=1 Tax=Butyrivibrio sp. YAB3001 TaxID=1520812 RepID=UPI0008F6299D|nr:hypothetical protein [Butyrivibrio sp. YAB3001]SFB81458.1 hypothetical protein SAMN02910398_00714 [Butyrivibrio sp. YAB3001]
MRKIIGKEITSNAMAQEYVDGFVKRLIKIVIAFALSFAPIFLIGKIEFSESSIWAVILVALIALIWWLIGIDKIMYLLKLIPYSAKKGWKMGKDFHSIIAACVLGYCFWGAVISYIVTAYVFVLMVGVAITGIHVLMGYFNARKYLAEA